MSESLQLQAVQQLGRTYRALLASFEAATGMSMPKWRVLLALYQDGSLSQKRLAMQLSMDPASLTRQVKAIEARGWVARHNDPADNRLTNVELTAAGRLLVSDMLPRRAAFIEAAFGGLPPGRIDLLKTLLQELEMRLSDARG